MVFSGISKSGKGSVHVLPVLLKTKIFWLVSIPRPDGWLHGYPDN
jgi:hypothetical protein